MGYSIHGDLHNTADYGLPQQRRRAWIFAILTAEMVGSEPEIMTQYLQSFRRWSVPLKACLDFSVTGEPQKRTIRHGEKWRKDFEQLCKMYGKARCLGYSIEL